MKASIIASGSTLHQNKWPTSPPRRRRNLRRNDAAGSKTRCVDDKLMTYFPSRPSSLRRRAGGAAGPARPAGPGGPSVGERLPGSRRGRRPLRSASGDRGARGGAGGRGGAGERAAGRAGLACCSLVGRPPCAGGVARGESDSDRGARRRSGGGRGFAVRKRGGGGARGGGTGKMACRMAAMAAGEDALASAVAWPSHAASSIPCARSATEARLLRTLGLNFQQALL